MSIIMPRNARAMLASEGLLQGEHEAAVTSAGFWEVGMWLLALHGGAPRLFGLLLGFTFHQATLWLLDIYFSDTQKCLLIFVPWSALLVGGRR